MRALRKLLRSHPRLRAFVASVVRAWPGQASGSMRVVPFDEVPTVRKRLDAAWLDASIPLRQRELVELELARLASGEFIAHFHGLAEMVARLVADQNVTSPSLLEIGCSSGYYVDVFRALRVNVNYVGCDISPSFIELARQTHPQIDFLVADAVQLPFDTRQFDVVLSGCCLLHIPEYSKAIVEAARVAKSFVVFHRTPIHHVSPTQYFLKKAYGVETLELSFNEQELVQLFASANLGVIDVLTIDTGWRAGDATAVKTYLCRKLS